MVCLDRVRLSRGSLASQSPRCDSRRPTPGLGNLLCVLDLLIPENANKQGVLRVSLRVTHSRCSIFRGKRLSRVRAGTSHGDFLGITAY